MNLSAPLNRQRRTKEGFVAALSTLACFATLAIFATFIVKIALDGVPRLRSSFFTGYLSQRAGSAGIFPALVGSFYVVSLAMIIVTPIGIAIAVYLEEVAPPNGKLAKWVSVSVANLAGVPSVVIGLVGLSVFVRGFGLGPSILAGALTLSLVVLPVVTIVTREALRSVPNSYREAAVSLGSSNWQTTAWQVFPNAWPRIVTGLLLAASRAIGETAPLMVAGAAYYVSSLPHSVFDAYTVLPLQIFSWSSDSRREFHQDAAAATLALVVFLVFLNLFTQISRRRRQS